MSTPNERIDKARVTICRSCNVFTERQKDTLAEALNALKDKPDPKPIKLEAGCVVRDFSGILYEVIGVDGDNLWLAQGDCRSCRSKVWYSVVEAAVPGIGDYVQCHFPSGKDCGGIIELMEGSYVIQCFCTWEEGLPTHYRRNDFTILHKAPKPENADV